MRVPLFWQSTFLLRTDKHRNLASKKTCECLKEVYLGTWERFHLLLTCPKIHGCDSQAWICKNVQMWDKSMSHRWKSFMNKWKTRIFTPHLLHSVWCESLCRTPSSCLWARAAGGERGGEGGEGEGSVTEKDIQHIGKQSDPVIIILFIINEKTQRRKPKRPKKGYFFGHVFYLYCSE